MPAIKSNEPIKQAPKPKAAERGLHGSFAGINTVTVRKIRDSLKGFGTLAVQLEWGQKERADFLGVTPRTLSRWDNEEPALSVHQLDSIEVLKEVVALGYRVLGSKEAFRSWLKQPSIDLNGYRGLDLISTESGRRHIEYALHQIEFGQF